MVFGWFSCMFFHCFSFLDKPFASRCPTTWTGFMVFHGFWLVFTFLTNPLPTGAPQ